jgi:sugar phosphate isomerase/epimerase
VVVTLSDLDLIAACWTTGGDCVPLPGREVSPLHLHERIDATARAGFTGFGIVHHDLAHYLSGGHTLRELQQRLSDAGIRQVQLEFLVDWWLPPEQQVASEPMTRLLLEASEVLQPVHVKTGPDVTGGDFHLDAYAERFHDVCERFAQVGTVLSMEFMPFGNVSTLAQAVDLIRTAGHPAGGLMIDLWHLMRGSGTLEELSQVPIELITGVELDDGSLQPVGTGYEDTINRRRLCGRGEFPVVEFIGIMHAMGWKGPWGLEIISEEHRALPLDKAVSEAYRTTTACFEEANLP